MVRVLGLDTASRTSRITVIEGGGRLVRNEAPSYRIHADAQAAGFSWDWMGRWTRPVGCSARRRSE